MVRPGPRLRTIIGVGDSIVLMIVDTARIRQRCEGGWIRLRSVVKSTIFPESTSPASRPSWFDVVEWAGDLIHEARNEE
jgi:hypothetical protein